MQTAIIPDAKASTVIPIIHEKVLPDNIVSTDSIQVHDVFDVSEFHHRRVNHRTVFVCKHSHHRNGIENFW
ncbi:MAG: transposase [Nitrospira sp.]|nr:transposase [Nitrospira sp.]